MLVVVPCIGGNEESALRGAVLELREAAVAAAMVLPVGGIVGNDCSQACRFNPGLRDILRHRRLLEEPGKKDSAYRQTCDRLVIQNAPGISSAQSL